MSEAPSTPNPQPAPARQAPPPSIEDRIAAAIAPEPAPGEPQEPPSGGPPEAPGAPDAPPPAKAEGEPAESAEPETGQEKAADGAPDADDALEVSALAELAEHFETDVDSLYGLTVPVSIGDVTEEMTIGDIKDNFSKYKKGAKAAEAAAKERETLQQEHAAQRTQYEQQLAAAQKLTQDLEQWALAEYAGVDWEGLNQQDPARYAAERQRYNERRAEVERAKHVAAQQLQQYQQQVGQQQQQSLAQHLEAQEKRLQQLIPEMGNPETSQAERSALAAYLPRAGLSPEEIQAVSHHAGLIAAVRKARLYDEMQAKIEPARKKAIKIAGRTLKPGGTQTKADQRLDQRSATRQRLRKTGKVGDAAAAIKDLLGG